MRNRSRWLRLQPQSEGPIVLSRHSLSALCLMSNISQICRSRLFRWPKHPCSTSCCGNLRTGARLGPKPLQVPPARTSPAMRHPSEAGFRHALAGFKGALSGALWPSPRGLNGRLTKKLPLVKEPWECQMTDLLLRKISEPRPGAEGQDDYDVIGDVSGGHGLVIGRIFRAYCACGNALEVETDLRGTRRRWLRDDARGSPCRRSPGVGRVAHDKRVVIVLSTYCRSS
jgi:hypothetical protein